MPPLIDEILGDRDINAQLQSSFFYFLPAELRIHVYRHALASFSSVAHSSRGSRSGKPHNFRIRLDHNGEPDDDLLGSYGDKDGLATTEILPELACTFPGHVQLSQMRPDLPVESCMSLNILLACRRMLVEARPVMFEAERNYWFTANPRYDSRPMGGSACHEYVASDRKLGWEKKFSRFRLFGPISEYHNFMSRHTDLLTHVRHLRITVRRTDWRLGVVAGQPEAEGIDPAACFGWGQGPLQINPLGPPLNLEITQLRGTRHANPNFAYMGAMMASTQSFGKPTEYSSGGHPAASCNATSWMPPEVCFKAGMWAREFLNMPCIRSFTMDFDTTQDKREQLAAIVEWAVRTWRFPLNPAHGRYHYLAAEESSVRRTSWRGTAADWDWLGPCASCSPRSAQAAGGEESMGQVPEPCSIPTHANIMHKFQRDLGPRIYSWSVTWTRRKHDGLEEFPYDDSGCLEVLPGDVKAGGPC